MRACTYARDFVWACAPGRKYREGESREERAGGAGERGMEGEKSSRDKTLDHKHKRETCMRDNVAHSSLKNVNTNNWKQTGGHGKPCITG